MAYDFLMLFFKPSGKVTGRDHLAWLRSFSS